MEVSCYLVSNYTTKQNNVVPAQKQTHRSMNRIERPDINPHLYGQSICDKGGKNIQWDRDGSFHKCYWGIQTDTCKNMRLPSYT